MGRRAEEAGPTKDRHLRRGSLILSLWMLIMAPLILVACGSDDNETVEPADYGTYGMQMAFRLANDSIAEREPYSANERATGDLILEELKLLGYQPEVQTFNVTHEDGSVYTSRNLIVRIDGEGFYSEEELEQFNERTPAVAGTVTQATKTKPTVYDKQIVIGTHYDSPYLPEDEPEETEEGAEAQSEDEGTTDETVLPSAKFDGISDNSSGVAALLTTARALVDQRFAYDIVLVFFGAGNDDHSGAEAYLASLSDVDRARTDCVYTVERIYAGDKLYAHAGHSSLQAGKKYDMRRKLYEATDVALEHNLRGTMGVDLVMNQGGYMVDVPGYEEPHIFREFTLHEGDYTPFDRAGIPIVFLEAAEYDVDSLDLVTESDHPAFEPIGGMVSGSAYDNVASLRVSLGSEILQKRINTVAFIFVEAIRKGSHAYVPVSEAELNLPSESEQTSTATGDPSGTTAK